MTTNRPTQALILAAGIGTRLAPETDNIPKCLVDIGGSSILAHQLRNCARAGLKETVVVSGYHWEKVDEEIARCVAAGLGGMKVRSAYNPFYDVSNNLVSLWAVRHEMLNGFISINGDDVFDPAILTRLLDAENFQIAVAVGVKKEYDDDDMKVSLANGLVTQINKTVSASDTNAESIGIMKFGVQGAARLSQELEAMVRLPTGLSDWYTLSIERIAKSGFEVGAVDIGALRWAEIDFPEDLARVRADFSELVK